MTDMPESGKTPDEPPEPIKPLKPKRGAFPTPQSEIDAAEPFNPETGEEDEPEGASGPPTVTAEEDE